MIKALSGAFSPTAVTVVGGSPLRGAAVQLLENLQRQDMPFRGPLYVVNRSRRAVAGIPAVADVNEIEGSLGVVYMMLSATKTVAWLHQLGDRRPEAVVCYAGGFAEVGNTVDTLALREWSVSTGVPVIGPQSLGFVHTGSNFVGLMVTLPETVITGPVAVLCQSGGLVAGSVRALLQRGIGIAAAVSYGNATAVGFIELAATLISDPTIKVVMVHTESIPDFGDLRAIGRLAHGAGKPILLHLAGTSDAGKRVVSSHTAAVATPHRIARGVCSQSGILWVEDVDDLIDGVEALVQAGIPKRLDARVGMFAGSGGGAIAVADALSAAGVQLDPPSGETVSRLRELGVTTDVNNPFDAGAALLDAPENYAPQVEVFAGDPNFGIICKVIGSSAPSRTMPAQLQQYEDFVKTIKSLGKIPFLATPITQQVDDPVQWEGVPWSAGARRAALKLQVLQQWAQFRGTTGSVGWWELPDTGDIPREMMVDFSQPTETLTGPLAGPFVEHLPIAIAPSVLITDDTEAAHLVENFSWPVVLKAETGLNHRALLGAVLGPLMTPKEVRAGLDLLAAKWGFPISANKFVEHDEEFMVGLEQLDGLGIFCSAGPGGVGAGDELCLFLSPLNLGDAKRLASHATERSTHALGTVLLAMQELPSVIPGFRSLEFNPITLDLDGNLLALDVKLIRSVVE